MFSRISLNIASKDLEGFDLSGKGSCKGFKELKSMG
jgi:hypothetical protein